MAAIEHLLAFKNQEALQIARAAAVALLSSEVSIEELVLSRQLGDSYATESHPHLQVAKLLEQRNPGAGPKPGDRIEFVWVETGDKHAKGYERAEDPAYVTSHPEVAVDKLQYFEKQLRSQLGDLFKHVVDGDPFGTPEITRLVEQLASERSARELACTLKKKRQRSLHAFFK